MIVNISQFGQLGNRLSIFSKFITLAVAEDIPVMNLGFSAYADDFEAFALDPFCRVPVKQAIVFKQVWMAQILRRSMKWLAWAAERFTFLQRWVVPVRADDNKGMDLADEAFIALAKSKMVIFLGGWPRLDNPNAKEKSAPVIRKILKPHEKYQQNIDALMKTARKMADVVIGVHIRQGDYEFWDGGKHYFSSTEYNQVMVNAERLFAEQRVVFIVVSDQVQERDKFTVEHILSGTGRLLEDLYVLAACDYSIGPQSTFSGWAAGYGYVPRYILNDVKTVFSLQDFVVR